MVVLPQNLQSTTAISQQSGPDARRRPAERPLNAR